MTKNLAWLLAGLVLGTASAGFAASPVGERAESGRNIIVRDDDRLVMRDLRWECGYSRNSVSAWTNAPPGPVLRCGRLGAWTGGIRTHTDLYYVVVRRGTNTNPRILLRSRRP